MRSGEYGHPSVAGAFQTRDSIHKGKPLTIMRVYPLRSRRECNYCAGIPAIDPKEFMHSCAHVVNPDACNSGYAQSAYETWSTTIFHRHLPLSLVFRWHLKVSLVNHPVVIDKPAPGTNDK